MLSSFFSNTLKWKQKFTLLIINFWRVNTSCFQISERKFLQYLFYYTLYFYYLGVIHMVSIIRLCMKLEEEFDYEDVYLRILVNMS
jgi:hypothetical protein